MIHGDNLTYLSSLLISFSLHGSHIQILHFPVHQLSRTEDWGWQLENAHVVFWTCHPKNHLEDNSSNNKGYAQIHLDASYEEEAEEVEFDYEEEYEQEMESEQME